MHHRYIAQTGAIEKSRRRPTLPGGSPPSTIGAGGLHFRVRNGNGCFPAAVATGNLMKLSKPSKGLQSEHEHYLSQVRKEKKEPKPSAD
jgi:hypothetical protein